MPSSHVLYVGRLHNGDREPEFVGGAILFVHDLLFITYLFLCVSVCVCLSKPKQRAAWTP